ncbi:tRNA-queuosine alpha-mannosyltransferase domain-containing protein [Biformimicrobium ophioploci]|uniref:tRNA-queuosine alpha-mannosyltransferase domain-containing protein n=1 Tax=Biformimicrobium ophioploci TaxID=3036711 RepID=UPI002554D50E|nr:DUF3524 domain-containing protein [Microbulbifer sp. NKW57]
MLLLSAYDAASHKRWREALVAHLSDWEFTCLALPPRYFSWRVRGNSLSWAFGPERALLEQPWDLLLATSMVDLSGLRGLVPALARVPAAVYFHENQFAYPESGREYGSVEPKLLNIYNALAADLVLFNSRYNRDTLLHGAQALLGKLPDAVPPGLNETIAANSSILPVPLEDTHFERSVKAARGRMPEVVWNHRWEFDKGPDVLLEALRGCVARGTRFRLHLVGEQFRRQPQAFAEIEALLRVPGCPVVAGEWGFMPSREAYHALLDRCDAVLSTARHDFQGLALLEAAARGCLPLAPADLAYPEWFGKAYLADWGFVPTPGRKGVQEEGRALAGRLQQLVSRWHNDSLPEPPDVSDLSWQKLGHCYRQVLQSV